MKRLLLYRVAPGSPFPPEGLHTLLSSWQSWGGRGRGCSSASPGPGTGHRVTLLPASPPCRQTQLGTGHLRQDLVPQGGVALLRAWLPLECADTLPTTRQAHCHHLSILGPASKPECTARDGHLMVPEATGFPLPAPSWVSSVLDPLLWTSSLSPLPPSTAFPPQPKTHVHRSLLIAKP